jgi:hypothetical protein
MKATGKTHERTGVPVVAFVKEVAKTDGGKMGVAGEEVFAVGYAGLRLRRS